MTWIYRINNIFDASGSSDPSKDIGVYKKNAQTFVLWGSKGVPEKPYLTW